MAIKNIVKNRPFDYAQGDKSLKEREELLTALGVAGVGVVAIGR